jgi:hypothetical protein
MFRSSSADPAKLKKLIAIFLWMPQIQLREAMESAKYSDEEITDVAFHRFLQRALAGGFLKGLRAYLAGEVALLPAPPVCSKQRVNHAINDNIEHTPSVNQAVNHKARAPATGITPTAFSTEPNPDKVSPVGKFVGPLMATASNKCKQHNCMYYMKNQNESSLLISCYHHDKDNS